MANILLFILNETKKKTSFLQFFCTRHVLQGFVILLNHSSCELYLLKVHILFCSFHLQLFHPKLSNMSAVLCCSSKVCFFQRCAPPSRLNISSILGSFMVWVTPPVSWNGREWISWRCSDSPGRATEGNWITTRSFCTNHRPPHHLCCSSDDHRPQTSSFLFYFLEINQPSDESGFQGKVWLQPESFVHTVWRSTGFSRPPASRYFIADVKSKAVRAEIYRLLHFVADGKRF